MATETTFIQFAEGAAPSTPASTKWRVYTKSDGLYVIDDAGTETGPLGVAGAATGSITGSAIAECSGAVTLTDTNQDVTGATLTIEPAAAEIWIVDGVWDLRWTTAAVGALAIGECHFDGVAQSGLALLAGPVLNRATVTQTYRISASAASHTVKLVARRGSVGAAEAQTESFIRVVRHLA